MLLRKFRVYMQQQQPSNISWQRLALRARFRWLPEYSVRSAEPLRRRVLVLHLSLFIETPGLNHDLPSRDLEVKGRVNFQSKFSFKVRKKIDLALRNITGQESRYMRGPAKFNAIEVSDETDCKTPL